MSREWIPDDVKRFILVSVPSIPYLEAMLLLRNHEGQWWDGKWVAQRLYLGEKAAGDLLSDLYTAGILACTGDEPPAYCYRPVSEELRNMIDRIAHIYATNLVEVTHLIHSSTGKKALTFADAFKWRKDS
jgi:hypothetical protein